MNTIEITPEVFDILQELKTQFAEMTNNPELSDNDVISVLVSGFIDSVQNDKKSEGCCGGGSCGTK